MADRLGSGMFPGAKLLDEDEAELHPPPGQTGPTGPSAEAAAYSTGAIEARRQQQADARRAERAQLEVERRELSVGDLSVDRLTFRAAWKGALLDPCAATEQPGYSEVDALAGALAGLRELNLSMEMCGLHMVYCRYSFAATRRQPAWIGLFKGETTFLVVVNADNARFLEMH